MIAKYGLIGFPLWMLWKWATVWKWLVPCLFWFLFWVLWVPVAMATCASFILGIATNWWVVLLLAIPMVLPICSAVWTASRIIARFLFVLPEKPRADTGPKDVTPTQEFEDWDQRFKCSPNTCPEGGP